MDFQVTGTLRHFAAILTGGTIALDCQTSLLAPVAAIVGMATRAATVCWIICADYVLSAAVEGTVKVFVFLELGRIDGKAVAAMGAAYIDSPAPFTDLELGRTIQAAKNMPAFFSGCLYLELLAAVFAGKKFDGVLGALGFGMLPAAINIISTKAIYAPAFHLDRLLAVGTGSIKQVAATLNILFSGVPFGVPVGRAFDDSAASAIA
jgi:hypothetical protein